MTRMETRCCCIRACRALFSHLFLYDDEAMEVPDIGIDRGWFGGVVPDDDSRFVFGAPRSISEGFVYYDSDGVLTLFEYSGATVTTDAANTHARFGIFFSEGREQVFTPFSVDEFKDLFLGRSCRGVRSCASVRYGDERSWCVVC